MTFSFIFYNSFGRLRSGWRSGVFVGLFVMLVIILDAIVNIAFGILSGSTKTELIPQFAFIAASSIFLFAAVFMGWVCTKGIEGLSFRSLGWSLRKHWWRDLLLGVFVGAGSLLLATGLGALGGGMSFMLNQTADFGSIANTVLLSAVVFAFAAAAEEALFRGYPLQTFARAKLIWIGALLSSAAFAWVHSDNQNVTLFGLINTGLAGIWFVAAYLKTRNLWLPFGMHWAWNWTMAAILGLPVSGITQITPEPILRGVDAGPVWLTGGHYGIEGGAACTITLIVSTIVIWYAPFFKPTPEMLALTTQENPIRENNPNNQPLSLKL
jgi:membrane protease YdiL (CAAX protease family)